MTEGSCKKEEHGNCGPIKDGDDYCLFHKPKKNEEEAVKFYEKLKKQATIETEENGKEKLVFKDVINWRGYVFPKGDDDSFFGGATFEGRVYFGKATFEDAVSFNWATFEDAVFFNRTTFEDRAAFLFANFEGEADFLYAIFQNEITFLDSTFKDGAYFDRAIFEFECKAGFEGTTFEGEASFWNATFEGEVSFMDATFENRASFFGSSCKKEASFMGTLFERTCTFENRVFEGKLLFTNTEFRQGVQVEKDWENPEPGKYTHPQAEQEGCRVQKISYENEGRKEAAEAMFVREMRARRREKIRSEKKPLWKMPGRYIFYWLEKWAIDKTCKYGTDWYSLLKATLLVIVSFSLIYFLSYFNIGFLGNLGQSSFYSFNFQWSWVLLIELFHALLQSIIFSIVTFTTLGSGILNPEGLIISLLVGLQSFIGAFFIALFVVVFARKWMR